MIALGVKQMFASRWTYPEVIYASFQTFYASETRVEGSLHIFNHYSAKARVISLNFLADGAEGRVG